MNKREYDKQVNKMEDYLSLLLNFKSELKQLDKTNVFLYKINDEIDKMRGKLKTFLIQETCKHSIQITVDGGNDSHYNYVNTICKQCKKVLKSDKCS